MSLTEQRASSLLALGVVILQVYKESLLESSVVLGRKTTLDCAAQIGRPRCCESLAGPSRIPKTTRYFVGKAARFVTVAL